MLRILTYHRIGELDPGTPLSPRMISATPRGFAAQMRHLARHWSPVGLDRVFEAIHGGKPLPRRAVLVTFDDAYRDFATEAMPILVAEGIPVALFAPTRFVDEPDFHFWWDRVFRAVHRSQRTVLNDTPLGTLAIDAVSRVQSQRLLETCLKGMAHENAMQWVDRLCAEAGVPDPPDNGVLNWDELRQLARDGVAIASHTHEHPLLTRVGSTRVAAELQHSLRRLEAEIGSSIPALCYPAGAHDDSVIEIARDAGFELGLTQCDGHNDLRRETLLRLARTNVTPRTSATLLGVRLQPWAPQIDRWRHRHKVVA